MKSNFHLTAVILVIALLLLSGCWGTFQTARVEKLKLGAYYFGTIPVEDNFSTGFTGFYIEGGWPAGPKQFGIGLNTRLGLLQDDDGLGLMAGVWGAKLQIPENSIVDIAAAVEILAVLPVEVKLLVSRRIGIFEPYFVLANHGIIALSWTNNESVDVLDDGWGYTVGTMVKLGSESDWSLGLEYEYAGPQEDNELIDSGVGLVLFKTL